jgi:CDP-glycerol glycerophosphotransferase
MQRYLDAGIVTRQQAVLVGYPKLDRLASGGFDPPAIRAALGLDHGRPVVLYAPTYSEASSLHIAGEAIVRALVDAGFSVVVKLHDRSLDADPRYHGGIDWRARFASMVTEAGRARLHFAEVADASPLLAVADLMVTDHSSVGFEYLVRDRPLIVFDAPDLPHAARINPQKVALLRSAATVVRTPDETAHAAACEFAEPQRLSAARRRIAADLFHEPGGATRRAVGLLGSLLNAGNSAAVMSSVAQPETLT